MVAAVTLSSVAPRMPRGEHAWRVAECSGRVRQRQAQGQRHTSSAASAITMVGTHRLVKVHVGLTVGGDVLVEVQAPPRAHRLRRSPTGLDASGVKWLPLCRAAVRLGGEDPCAIAGVIARVLASRHD